MVSFETTVANANWAKDDTPLQDAGPGGDAYSVFCRQSLEVKGAFPLGIAKTLCSQSLS